MTAEFPSNSRTTMAPSDEQIVQELLPELTYSSQNDSEYILDEQRRLAWERDQARIKDFFNHPGQYIGKYWQRYQPVAIAIAFIAVLIIALNFVLSIIGFILGVPLLGGLLELVGLGYSIWFAKRYLLAATTRHELLQKIEQLKQDILGTAEEVMGNTSLDAKKSVVIQKSPEDLYRFWRNFENLPRFMSHLESVQILDDKRSHWIAKAPLDTKVEWDAEIIDEKENQSIVWRSLDGAEVDSTGSVAFISLNGSGTEVKVTMKYNPPAGAVGAAAAAVFGENPQQQLDEDLERFKQVMESNLG